MENNPDFMHRAEEQMRDLRYEDPIALANVMVWKRKTAREAKGTQQETKARFEHEIAMLRYDIAFLLQENKIMREMMDIILNFKLDTSTR